MLPIVFGTITSLSFAPALALELHHQRGPGSFVALGAAEASAGDHSGVAAVAGDSAAGRRWGWPGYPELINGRDAGSPEAERLMTESYLSARNNTSPAIVPNISDYEYYQDYYAFDAHNPLEDLSYTSPATQPTPQQVAEEAAREQAALAKITPRITAEAAEAEQYYKEDYPYIEYSDLDEFTRNRKEPGHHGQAARQTAMNASAAQERTGPARNATNSSGAATRGSSSGSATNSSGAVRATRGSSGGNTTNSSGTHASLAAVEGLVPAKPAALFARAPAPALRLR